MQNWKIKRMSVNKINVWIKAIDLLIEDFKDTRPCRGCPLCDVAGVGCSNCLWLIIEQEDCYDFAERNGFKNGPKRWEKKWWKLRLPMLPRWKKILKTELARRDQ